MRQGGRTRHGKKTDNRGRDGRVTIQPHGRVLLKHCRARRVVSGTILWSMGRSPSHVAATFSLARRLRGRGHRCVYLAPTSRLAVSVRAAGFEAVTPQLQAESDGGFRDLIDWVERGGLRALLREQAPSLVLGDVVMPHAALLACSMGLPAGLVAPLFLSTRDPGVPPSGLRRLIVPAPTCASRLRILAAWHRANLRHLCVELVLAVERRLGSRNLAGLTSRRAWRTWTPSSRVDVLLRGDGRSFLPSQLPVFVLCPEALEYPRARRSNHHYLGPCLDFEQVDPAVERFPWQAVDRRRRLVLCMLGDLVDREPRICLGFWRALVEAAQGDSGARRAPPAGCRPCDTGWRWARHPRSRARCPTAPKCAGR